ncbi:MAG: argininosuccinate lyase [Saprospiraceae bacterium]|jgi:argininosuccinate lyase|nr:argininosuccinate lyase [Saprospiraceae bacterium]
MKLWEKDFLVQPQIDAFTVGKDREMDLLLAKYDVLGSLAHIQMLESIQLISKNELEVLSASLKNIYQDIEKGLFKMDDDVEDVHSQIELLLTKSLGDIGKKIHSGRSRNDQVLVDLRLFFRAELQEIVRLMELIFHGFQEQSEQHKDVLMPGYTHFQVAMVSSFGLWFGAYAESLTEDLSLLESVFNIVNHNPLGSAAGYGSSFPLNRKMTTELLGFEDLSYNVIHAQMGRGKSELFIAFALASLATTLGKFSMDVVLYSSQNYHFLTLPKEYTTGSSIMPHKKNPDVFELLRGKCNLLQALPGQVSLLINNLPAGYHRDFQLLKEVIFPAIHNMKECLEMIAFVLPKLKIHDNLMDDPKYAYLFTVEKVNELVLEGVPFRDAYKQVGEMVEKNEFVPGNKISHVHEGSIGQLCNKEIFQKWKMIKDRFPFGKIEEKCSVLTRIR